MDKLLKLSIIFGILIIAVSLFYFFLLRPRQEQKAYSDCLSALRDSDKLNDYNIQTPHGKTILDVCVKSRGAEGIRREGEKEKIEAAKQSENEQNVKSSLINNL